MLISFKKIFKIILYSPPSFSGKVQKLEELFRQITDPWNFEKSVFEYKRYQILLEYIKNLNPKKVLELGCAEGVFTQKLSKICKDITAVEVSKTAIKRAKKRVVKVRFINSDFIKLTPKFEKEFFDLVIASEVLYYLKENDICQFLRTLRTNFLLTSNFWTLAWRVERIIKKAGFKIVEAKRINYFEDFIIKSSKISLWKRQKSLSYCILDQ